MKTGGTGGTGGQLALALAAGYMLGRRKKTRLALLLGTAALTGGLSGATGQLMRSGTKLLGSSDGLGKVAGDVVGEAVGKAAPGLGDVGDMVRQDLTAVVKRAVATAVSKQIESLSDQLRDRAEAIREQSAGSARKTSEDEEDETEDMGDGEPRVRHRVPFPRQRDEQAEEEAEEPAEAEEEPAARAPRSGAASRSRAASRSGEGLRSGARSARSAASSPIRRTRR